MSANILAKIGDDVLNQIFVINQLGTDARPEEILKFAISFVCMSCPEYQSIAFFKTQEGVVKYNPVLIAALAERLQFEKILEENNRSIDENAESLPKYHSTETQLVCRDKVSHGSSLHSDIKTTRYRQKMIVNIWNGISKYLTDRNIIVSQVEMPEDENVISKQDRWTLDISDNLNENFDYLQNVISVFSVNIYKFCVENNLNAIFLMVETVNEYSDRKVGWYYKAKGYVGD